MPAWQAQIRLGPPAGGWQDVTVQADDMFRAIAMLEAQYGKGSIVAGLRQVSTGIPSAEPQPSTPSTPSTASSRRDSIALFLGIAVLGFLLWLNVPWQWAAGIAVPIWFGYAWFGPEL
jgi:hypothetical protein